MRRELYLSLKKSGFVSICHSRENGNPVFYHLASPGFPPAPEGRLLRAINCGFFSSKL